MQLKADFALKRSEPKGEASAQAIDQLEPILYTASPNTIKQQLKAIVPEYTPHFE